MSIYSNKMKKYFNLLSANTPATQMDIEEIPAELVSPLSHVIIIIPLIPLLSLLILSLLHQVEFRQAALDVKGKLKVRPADDELLILYGLFKQGLVGDNNTSKLVG